MNSVKAHIGKAHFSTTIISENQLQILADEPLDAGGQETGFNPGELLCASLAACMTITLRMYADHKTWPLDRADVKVTLVRDAEKNTFSIQSYVQLHGNLTNEQRKRLGEIAGRCPIHKLLTHPVSIETILEEETTL